MLFVISNRLQCVCDLLIIEQPVKYFLFNPHFAFIPLL